MASGTGNLPNQNMDFTPFDILTAEEMDDLVENIESLADGTGIGDGAVTPAKWTNPYRFIAYRNGSWTTPNNTIGKVNFNEEIEDPNNDFDSSTNYRYVAPVTGTYFLSTTISFSAVIAAGVFIYKNGSDELRATQFQGTNILSVSASGVFRLTAGDYVEAYVYTNTNVAGTSGVNRTVFSGFLINEG